jgi:hypothetical protein
VHHATCHLQGGTETGSNDSGFEGSAEQVAPVGEFWKALQVRLQPLTSDKSGKVFDKNKHEHRIKAESDRADSEQANSSESEGFRDRKLLPEDHKTDIQV